MNPLAMPKTAVVVPTIRSESMSQFAAAWEHGLSGATVIVVEDNPNPTFSIGRNNWLHFAHADIDRELGSDAWVVPRTTDCIRSYGILKALQLGAEVIVSLDDDCYPSANFPDFLASHIGRLAEFAVSPSWLSTCVKFKPRGYPYFAISRNVPTVVSHGLWEEAPDFDSPTQLLSARVTFESGWFEGVVPKGLFFPMCGMNVAFRRAIAPAFYFLLMGPEHPFDRFGDIWSGIIVKRICDHLNLGVRTGSPAIRHVRASNVWRNLGKEAPTLEWNERFWVAVDEVMLTGTTVTECYAQVAEGITGLDHPYFTELGRAMQIWGRLASAALQAEPIPSARG